MVMKRSESKLPPTLLVALKRRTTPDRVLRRHPPIIGIDGSRSLGFGSLWGAITQSIRLAVQWLEKRHRSLSVSAGLEQIPIRGQWLQVIAGAVF